MSLNARSIPTGDPGFGHNFLVFSLLDTASTNAQTVDGMKCPPERPKIGSECLSREADSSAANKPRDLGRPQTRQSEGFCLKSMSACKVTSPLPQTVCSDEA